MRRDPWLLGVLALSATLGVYQLDWGLPNGNDSWAADALGPLTVLSIWRRSLMSWNSGWFYFKYPLGYPLVLLASYAPYLGWLIVTGQWRHPRAEYPYGFSHPEAALHTLALLGRCVGVACVVATVVLTYDIGRRLLGRTAARLAAVFVATAYPLVYYGHTTNLDAAYLFWLILALWATIVASESERRWPWVVLGVAAAMAVSTKEQGFAFLLPLPVILAVQRALRSAAAPSPWRRWVEAVWNPGSRAGVAATVIAVALANNGVMNPSGFMNRLLYLGGRQIPGVSARLAPVEFKLFKGGAKEWQYFSQLVDGIESTFGLPLFVVAVAGLIYVAWRRPFAGVLLLVPAAAQYYLSLRTLDLITLRYTLPISVAGALGAGALCAALLETRWRAAAGAIVVALCVLAVARALELDLVLRNDARYRAESWMRAHMTAADTVEVYQKPAYLPRMSVRMADFVPLDERSIDGVARRQPGFIVISSLAKKGITHRWNPDWRQGRTLLSEAPPASAFLRALEGEQLSYARVARFGQRPRLLRVRITSLCPEISIFQRATKDGVGSDRPTAEALTLH